MNAQARKLVKALGVSYQVAVALVEAGLTTENRAKQADAKTLSAIAGIGEATVAQIQGK